LLRYVRKWKNINNLELDLLVKSYLDNINNAFDFISPVINKDKDFDNINKIWAEINSWKISKSSLEKNYKWTYTAKAIEAISEWKEWMRIFVDIVDMWIMNLRDFRSLAKKVALWKIKWDNITELLDAWLSVTKQFQDFVKEIEKIPWSKVSLWWDEVFIFIEWKTPKEIWDIIAKISENLDNNNLRWRVSYSFDKNSKWIFDSLDSLTKINKVVEKKIEEVIVWWKILYEVPNNLTLDINPKIIWNEEWDFDKFLKQMESSINFVKLLDVIQSKKVWEMKIWKFDDKIVSLKRNNSNEFILSIK
jgi:hypothetical protein